MKKIITRNITKTKKISNAIKIVAEIAAEAETVASLVADTVALGQQPIARMAPKGPSLAKSKNGSNAVHFEKRTKDIAKGKKTSIDIVLFKNNTQQKTCLSDTLAGRTPCPPGRATRRARNGK